MQITRITWKIQYITNSFFLKPTNEEEVNSITKQMKTNKAIGPNSILTKILKINQHIIAKPLVHLINLSFSTGVFPDLLKIANIKPVLKKGDRQDYNNYRPISLISDLSKLNEKLAHERLYNFLEKYSLLFEKQYGFRAKMSTNQALIDITNKIQETCDKGSFACGVFLDFKKAFDTVNHNILLHKLYHYGVRGTESNWFKSYLGTRHQHTTVNSFSFKNAYNGYGVLQCSVLGQLLFLIYI